MPGKTKFPVFIQSALFLLLLQGNIAVAQYQQYLDKKITLSFHSVPLATVLSTIGTKTGVKFSYNPELIQTSRLITMRFTNIPLREALRQLINDEAIAFREIGNQIVLYRGEPEKFPLQPNQQLIVGKPQLVIPPKKNPDTLYVYRLDTLIIKLTDTILRRISITHFDTIRFTDTVFLKPEPKKRWLSAEISDTSSVSGKRLTQGKGFYTGIYFETLPGTINYKNLSGASGGFSNKMEQASSVAVSRFSTGVHLGYDFKRVGLRTGIGYTKLGEMFNYSYSLHTGGYYKTDTVESAYYVLGIDTTWFYITDSTWIPKDSKTFRYRQPNTFRYINFPVSLKLQLRHGNRIDFYALGGVNMLIPVSSEALVINDNINNDVSDLNDINLNPLLLFWHAGLGCTVKFSLHSGMFAEATYTKQTNNQFKDLFLEKRYGLIGLKLAAYLKF